MIGRPKLVTACALVLGLAASGARAQDAIKIEQGWSPQDKTTWYTLSQGSRLIPASWLRALEQPGPSVASAPKRFLDRAHIESFRYLPPDSAGADQLPIGFAIDKQDDKAFETTKLRWKNPQSSTEQWVGFNCAACHTTELTFQGKRMRVEGAPTLADFQQFMAALNQALVETRDDAGKFERFAKGVLTPSSVNNQNNRNLLMGELKKLIAWQLQVETANKTPLQYGFARLDAVGHIFNKVLLRVKADPQFLNPSDAPVSYPFLWNIHQHNKVQWNGIAPNGPLVGDLDVGALGRNVGEVIGVFADLQIRPFGPAAGGYPSSANVANLDQLERQITRLLPPVWPDALPAIDVAKWQAGRTLFDNRCARCHKVLPRSDLKTPFEVEMTPLIGAERIGTDPWMACNAYTYQARVGLLKHTPKKFFLVPPSFPLDDPDAVATMLGTSVIGAIWHKAGNVLQTLKPDSVKGLLQSAKPFELKKGSKMFDSTEFIAQLFPEPQPTEKAARLKRCLEESADTLAYKGRPLTGIWATPPYLHNGSVPTLFDLLLAPKDRPQSFALGTREFDPEKVGYVTNESKFATDKTKAENTFVLNTRDANGAIAGNSNDGHDYGNAGFTDADRMALVEYMKAVGGQVVGGKVVP